MRSSIAIAAAVAARFAAADLVTATDGGAVIINQCGWDIPMDNVPAMKDGVENAQSTSTMLSANGGSYSTNWVQLLSGGGWSMKLDALNNGNLMQYEYTYMPDGSVWYDLSFVGVPADEQSKFPSWGFEAPGPKPHAKAYTAWNDDANGMQTPVASNAHVTLLLCTGSDKAGSSNTAPATYAAPTTTEAPAAPTTLQTTTTPAPVSVKKAAVQATTQATTTPAPAPAPTTTSAPAPVVAAAPSDDDSDAVVVTEFETKIVTAVVTELANGRRKRHAHGHARHGHPQ